MKDRQIEDHNPGEWELDEWGKRFRRVGNCIEYATIIETTDGAFYEDELIEYQKRKKQQEEQRLKEIRHFVKKPMSCPFKMGRHDLNVNCVSDCVFYDGSKCTFSKANEDQGRDPKGKYCPITSKCREDCAFYNGGCSLISIVKR